MGYDEKDIDMLLENWYTAKQELSVLEKKIEKYKKYADMVMDKEDENCLANSRYTLSRREMNRTILAKDDVPRDIWNKYSKNITYSMITIRKNK
jgi:hypothetical protein